jgi:hypothetical protein
MYDGIHKALDVTTRKSLYQFDALEAGDMLSLDPTGEYCFDYLYSPTDRLIPSRSNISFIHPCPREQAPTPYLWHTPSTPQSYTFDGTRTFPKPQQFWRGS